MDSRETALVTMTRLDIPDAETERVEVYVDDGTPVDPDLRARHLGTPEPAAPPTDTVTVTRAELADMIATATAAAVAAHADSTGPDAARTAALAAIEDQTT